MMEKPKPMREKGHKPWRRPGVAVPNPKTDVEVKPTR
jgi:hypothetical protein